MCFYKWKTFHLLKVHGPGASWLHKQWALKRQHAHGKTTQAMGLWRPVAQEGMVWDLRQCARLSIPAPLQSSRHTYQGCFHSISHGSSKGGIQGHRVAGGRCSEHGPLGVQGRNHPPAAYIVDQLELVLPGPNATFNKLTVFTEAENWLCLTLKNTLHIYSLGYFSPGDPSIKVL